MKLKTETVVVKLARYNNYALKAVIHIIRGLS